METNETPWIRHWKTHDNIPFSLLVNPPILFRADNSSRNSTIASCTTACTLKSVKGNLQPYNIASKLSRIEITFSDQTLYIRT